jgi:hypothetical protein
MEDQFRVEKDAAEDVEIGVVRSLPGECWRRWDRARAFSLQHVGCEKCVADAVWRRVVVRGHAGVPTAGGCEGGVLGEVCDLVGKVVDWAEGLGGELLAREVSIDVDVCGDWIRSREEGLLEARFVERSV